MKAALTTPRSKRVKTIEITPDLLLDLLKVDPGGEPVQGGTLHFEDDAIPSNAKALRAGLTADGNISLMLESDEFPQVHEGNVITTLTPLYRLEVE